jgi:hypothetical protein
VSALAMRPTSGPASDKAQSADSIPRTAMSQRADASCVLAASAAPSIACAGQTAGPYELGSVDCTTPAVATAAAAAEGKKLQCVHCCVATLQPGWSQQQWTHCNFSPYDGCCGYCRSGTIDTVQLTVRAAVHTGSTLHISCEHQ